MGDTARTSRGGRYFLRNIATGKFFKTPTTWTDHMADAFAFPRASEALTTASQIGSEYLEMIATNSQGRVVFGARLDHPSPPLPANVPAPAGPAAIRPRQPC